MKNSECTIYIIFKDKCINKFRKEKEGWMLTCSNGTVRPCTAEQMVSHLLPALAGIKGPHVTVKVEPDNKTGTYYAKTANLSTTSLNPQGAQSVVARARIPTA